MNLRKAYKILAENKNTYNEVAEEFYQTRKKYSSETEELKAHVKEKEKVLDLGCGTGRLYGIFKDKNVDYTGIDFSEKLIQIAKGKYGDRFVLGDILNLPLPDENFDSVWAIASLHHIPTKKFRKKVLGHIKRVLRPGGRVIATCWKIKSFLRKDVYIPFHGKKRYYHVFSMRELKRLFKKSGFIIEELRYLKRGDKKTNILIIGKK
jgi:ubiquinone/menaquinone biosynthesis C-methylase UbiE